MRNLLLRFVLACMCSICSCLTAADAQQTIPPLSPPENPPQLTPGAWTMVVIPDTQSYVDHSTHLYVLNRVMDWIVAERQRLNIQLVLQEGDLVFENDIANLKQSTGDQLSEQQWNNVRAAFGKLDGCVPYIVVPGNHDYGTTCAEDRHTYFSRFFPDTDSANLAVTDLLAAEGPNAFGIRTLENAAYRFCAPDGRRLLIFALEWGPRQAAVDWASSIARQPEFADDTKLLLTHAYLYWDGTRYDWAAKGAQQTHNPHSYAGTKADTNDGEDLWNELIKGQRHWQLVLCGHVAGDSVGYLKSSNDFGESVHQLVFNAQWGPLGGEGWLRLLKFEPDGTTVHVQTYSPYFDMDGDPQTSGWRTDSENDMRLQLSPPPAC